MAGGRWEPQPCLWPRCTSLVSAAWLHRLQPSPYSTHTFVHKSHSQRACTVCRVCSGACCTTAPLATDPGDYVTSSYGHQHPAPPQCNITSHPPSGAGAQHSATSAAIVAPYAPLSATKLPAAPTNPPMSLEPALGVGAIHRRGAVADMLLLMRLPHSTAAGLHRRPAAHSGRCQRTRLRLEPCCMLCMDTLLMAIAARGIPGVQAHLLRASPAKLSEASIGAHNRRTALPSNRLGQGGCQHQQAPALRHHQCLPLQAWPSP